MILSRGCRSRIYNYIRNGGKVNELFTGIPGFLPAVRVDRGVNVSYTSDMAQKAEHDPAMAAVLAAFEKSGLSLHELGVRMGYPVETARMSAWQFVQKTSDPRMSMVRRFAKAMGIPIETLVAERPAKRKRPAESA